jgi:hypothetical protein
MEAASVYGRPEEINNQTQDESPDLEVVSDGVDAVVFQFPLSRVRPLSYVEKLAPYLDMQATQLESGRGTNGETPIEKLADRLLATDPAKAQQLFLAMTQHPSYHIKEIAAHKAFKLDAINKTSRFFIYSKLLSDSDPDVVSATASYFWSQGKYLDPFTVGRIGSRIDSLNT